MPRDDLSSSIHQEFGEIPFDGRTEQAEFLVLQVFEQRMRLVAVDVDLGKHRKRDRIVARAELLDLRRVARLLAAELVAGKDEYREGARRKLPMHLFEALVLRGEAAGARGVDDQEHLALELLQR